MECSIPLSVADFLQSKCFNDGVILLEHESHAKAGTADTAATHAGPLADLTANNYYANINCGDGKFNRQRMDNTARVALLLTRAFADFSAHHDLVTLQLNDFFIASKSLAKQAIPCTDSNLYNSKRSHNNNISSGNGVSKNAVNGRNGHQDLHTNFGFFSQFDGNADSYQKDFKQTNLQSGLKGVEGNGDDADCYNARQEEMEPNRSMIPNLPDVEVEVLLRIDILCPTRMHNPQHHLQSSTKNELQILGRLLYSLFSHGGLPPCNSYVMAAPLQEVVGSGSSKSRKRTEVSLFSQLIEKELIPVSLCRLISDLVDIGPNGKAKMPYESFQDVIQDLEQMVSQPSTFLHDSKYLHIPMFGQRYLDRDLRHSSREEVAKLLQISTMMKESLQKSYVGCPKFGTEAAFISGIAGSGKSYLVQAAGDFLIEHGWIAVRAKFERGKQHASRMILSFMFDELIAYLVKMKEEETSPEDKAYSRRASKAIWDAIGHDTLTLLADFLPSLKALYDLKKKTHTDAEMPGWQVIYSLTKVLEAVLESDRFVMICCDDIMWADKTSLDLLKSILSNLGSLKHLSRRCLFVGLYREDEVDDSHPVSILYNSLQKSDNVNTTEIKLCSLTKKNVEDIIMRELRLTRRSVAELANVVHKKTSGHAIFIVELLNSLIRDSTISYNSLECRYDWDAVSIDLLETGDSVASLIASNMYSLPMRFQRVLQILACFGIQVDIPLARILEKFERGLISSLDSLIERGILDRAGPLIMFSHDLIQLEVSTMLPPEEQKALHLELGELLGSVANIDTSVAIDTAVNGIDQIELNDTFFAGRSMSSHLICLACDQINIAKRVNDNAHRIKFIRWNLCAGQKSYYTSDFRAALFYFKAGIDFIGDECWYDDIQSRNYRVCLQLHEGAVLASYELGEVSSRYANAVVQNVPFKDTLVTETVLLKSSSLQSGKHNYGLSKGVDILRKLGFDIPATANAAHVMNAMAIVDSMASQLDFDGIMDLCEKNVDNSAQVVIQIFIQIFDALYVSAMVLNSPFLPLIASEIIKYSLQHGILSSTSTAFATFALFKIKLEGDYAASQKWATLAKAITKKDSDMGISNIKTNMCLYGHHDIWFAFPKEICPNLLNSYNAAMQIGDVGCAMLCLQMYGKYLILGGEKLPLININVKTIEKYSPYPAKYAALDHILLMRLMGKSGEPVYSKEDIRAFAKSANDIQLNYQIELNDFLLAFWGREDYIVAEKHCRMAWSIPTSKTPQVLLIYHTFFRGLVAFQLYRTLGGGDRLKEGIETMDTVENWAQISNRVFESKWLLLKAEYTSTLEENKGNAEELYKKSMKAAHDQGNIHELGLACELLGSFYLAHKCKADSISCYKRAYVCYSQWGALAVAETIAQAHNLDTSKVMKEVQAENSKHSRPWD